MENKFLEGKIAIISGANRGLGKEMAICLGEVGAQVALVGRDRSKLEETHRSLAEKQISSEIFTCDVSDEVAVEDLKSNVAERIGIPAILINNAGTAIRKEVCDFTLEEWRTVIDTNLTGAFLMSRAFLPEMKKLGWGRVINITSIMASVGSPGRSAYCASKSGLLALTKCMALELAQSGVNVVAISPGFYATDLTEPLRLDHQKNAALLSATPMGKWGKPEDIGKIARFLCSDAADFITGTDILSDGGWLAQ